MIGAKANFVLEQVAHLCLKIDRGILRWLLARWGIEEKHVKEVVKIVDRKDDAIRRVDEQFTRLEKKWAEQPPASQVPLGPVQYSPRPSNGYVYFIFNESSNAIKIGYSINPRQRLAELQTSSPVPLALVAVVRGSMVDERRYHALFAEHRLSGEWFAMHGELSATIKDLRRKNRPKRGAKAAA